MNAYQMFILFFSLGLLAGCLLMEWSEDIRLARAELKIKNLRNTVRVQQDEIAQLHEREMDKAVISLAVLGVSEIDKI